MFRSLHRLTAAMAAGSLLVAAFAAPRVLAHDGDASVEAAERVPVPFEYQHGNVVEMSDGRRSCRTATYDETMAMKFRQPGEPLAIINAESVSKVRRGGTGGFNLVLRGTTQLDGFPSAKAAFIRAAETWMALIRTPATVYIDVDFGPTRFGSPYPGGVLGSTDSNFPDFGTNWSSMRSRLISRANSQAETDLLNTAPSTSGIPTTEGNCTIVYLSEIPNRALGVQNSTAPAPTDDPGDGSVPSIGFNSAFLYDFDPSNGVDSNKQDFNATALHEIGHALGFVSHTGLKELVPSNPVIVTTWDLYRFRTGISTATFPTAQRVTSSGGEQVQFTGGGTTRLSTGRPDGSGGDNNQASHWKDNVQNSGTYIGIMDPTGADGDLDELTQVDLDTLDFIGYDVKDMMTVDAVTGSLDGNALSIVASVTAANRRITSVRTQLLSASDQPIGDPLVTTVNSTGQVQADVPVLIDVASALAATKVSVVAVDNKGNTSAATVLDFGQAEPGGGSITSATFNGKRLTINGSGFGGTVTVEVNGVVVAPPLNPKVNGAGTKVKVKANAATLGLRSGPNRIRVSTNGAFSSVSILNN